jgi:pimeloyl-ACP methyl ester carboxylesterase
MERSTLETSKGKIEYHLSGSGKPVIVLINGGSGPIEGWMKILPDISETSTVLSYNRLGVGGSDKPKEAQDGRTIIQTLREALEILGVEPPYVLVGHSLGGLYANLFARLYPNEVAGMVFLEASHPKDLALNQSQGKTVKAINHMLSVFDSFSSHKQYNEVNFVKETVNQIQQEDSFPDIPVYVITGGKENRMVPADVRHKRLAHQLEYLSLASNSKHIVAEKSGHFPQLTDPQIVIETIKACVELIDQVKK